jgi:hypothetical protein
MTCMKLYLVLYLWNLQIYVKREIEHLKYGFYRLLAQDTLTYDYIFCRDIVLQILLTRMRLGVYFKPCERFLWNFV